jgi:hypothetical protein
MKWITRERVKVDRVACPWLIKRFIDPQAEFVFVPAAEVVERASELGATPFDIEGCEFGHHGEDVSFDSIRKRFSLGDPALKLLAEIVRGFSVLGLSDHEILESEFIVYDALYAECQRRIPT